MSAALASAKRIVVKVGSSLVTRDGRGLDREAIAAWAAQIDILRRQGKQVVLVSSGAVAEGVKRLGWSKRPHAVHELQAAAAVGQMGLVEAYERCFRDFGVHAAQVLLTHEDLADRKRYLNARSTLRTLLDLNVIPVVNENDTVATDEIRFGDNDTLGALVANLIEADCLVILTDQQGLFTADPRKDPGATLVREAAVSDRHIEQMASGAGSALGRGGMLTKVLAARRAAGSGAHTIIASGREPQVLVRLAEGEAIGTLIVANQRKKAARKQWFANHLQFRGRIVVDEGAERALCAEGKSLLPVGVVAVEGEFGRGEVVACFNTAGREIARGLINYSAEETRRILRKPSSEIEKILGYVDEPELMHRDDMVIGCD